MPKLNLSPRTIKIVAAVGAAGLVLSTGANLVLGTGDIVTFGAAAYALLISLGLPTESKPSTP